MNKRQPTGLEQLTTESSNPAAADVDRLSSLEIVQLMNQEDASIAAAVASQADSIAQAIDVITDRISRNGRLIYIGAGTSGRLGVLDASECPPTFSTPAEMVVGLIAGGPAALSRSIEGAEDDPQVGEDDLRQVELSSDDVLVGIASSGRTPYVIGGLQYGQSLGTFTIGLSCNRDSLLEDACQLMIVPVVGAEILTGSTRLKAGTATKMVLNMLTTGAMIRLGKTYGNLMVDLNASNTKLVDRALRITGELTGLDQQAASELLETCDGELKTAIVVHSCSVTAQQARARLAESGGQLREAMEEN